MNLSYIHTSNYDQMKQILINSELPLTMLDRNVELNQYDFVLFHLYKEYPEYREYYKNLRITNPTRTMILDNSAYEFFVKGEKLDLKEFADVVIELRPDYYILPDKLMDKDETLDMTFSFLAIHERDILRAFARTGKRIPKPLAVAQGNSARELFDCLLKYNAEKLHNVALPFHNSFFKDEYNQAYADRIRLEFGKLTDDHRYMLGRHWFIASAKLLLQAFDYVHLLGSHCPFEKRLYEEAGFDFIKSIDTGYPVKCAIAGYEMFKEPAKPDIIIDQFMTTPLTNEQKALIDLNINKFKSL